VAAKAPPAALAMAGKRLWKSVHAAVIDGCELDERELAVLERACTCADTITQLEKAVKRDGLTARGSRGQVVVHPAVGEVRQQKLTLLRLLGALDLGAEESPAAGTASSRRARRAADARWAHRDELDSRRRAART
jgi:phage terminase small subunit